MYSMSEVFSGKRKFRVTRSDGQPVSYRATVEVLCHARLVTSGTWSVSPHSARFSALCYLACIRGSAPTMIGSTATSKPRRHNNTTRTCRACKRASW